MEIVSKNLRHTDVRTRLTIPSKSLKFFPPLRGHKRAVDFDVRDESDRVWKFRLWTRKKRMKKVKYLKPVLTMGWREFVRSKELRVRDRVVFYMEKQQAGGGVKYRVIAEKTVKLFGVVFAYKPIHIVADTRQEQVEEPRQERPNRVRKVPRWLQDYDY
ncbi:hypothetical protein PTKIN_Ptkin10aG0190300 [Pterospermum kingtungense]